MLTKSRLMAWRQCPKRLWLEARAEPEERPSGRMATGLSVGELARRLLGDERAELVDRQRLRGEAARLRTTELLADGRIVFEGAFGDDALVVHADIVRPTAAGWELIEVKESGSAKPHHIEDAAIQLAAARRSDLPPDRIVIAHLDTKWTYPGGDDYRGLFVETDVSEEARGLADEVDDWMAEALRTLALETRPERATGRHCGEPYPCRFQDACRAVEPVVDRPLSWLPGKLRREAKALQDGGARSMDELPDETLNALQLRVKTQTLINEEYFDQMATAEALAACAHPLHFLDFETVNPAIPLWEGTRPYAQIPFQFSLHVASDDGRLDHGEFLFTSGADPSRPFAEALIEALGEQGSIVVYNAAFERTRIRELADRFPDLRPQLEAAMVRIFDLQPAAKAHYYHPAQRGSWSIKKVLPCLAPELRYDELEGVQDGAMAIEAYFEILAADCPPDRRRALEAQLLRYCRLDTLAMAAIWARFAGSEALRQAVIAAGR